MKKSILLVMLALFTFSIAVSCNPETINDDETNINQASDKDEEPETPGGG